jgi:hypothetical protein
MLVLLNGENKILHRSNHEAGVAVFGIVQRQQADFANKNRYERAIFLGASKIFAKPAE